MGNQYIQQLLKYQSMSMPDKAHSFRRRLRLKNFPVDKLHNWFDRFDPAKNLQRRVYILLRLWWPGKFPPDMTHSSPHQ
jgi:hypothetical protein